LEASGLIGDRITPSNLDAKAYQEKIIDHAVKVQGWEVLAGPMFLGAAEEHKHGGCKLMVFGFYWQTNFMIWKRSYLQRFFYWFVVR
jgi:hypothetical protein